MFEQDILITGKHAMYMKELGGDKSKTFKRLIDVYMLGAIVGYSYNIQADVDKESEYKNVTARIFADTVIRLKNELEFIYRIILLVDDRQGFEINDRINRAFRHDASESFSLQHNENKKIFNSYVLGGIEFLYEKIYETNPDSKVDKVYDFFDDWETNFNLVTRKDFKLDSIIK